MRSHANRARAAEPPRKVYLLGPFYDGLLLIFSPLLAMGIGLAIADTSVANAPLALFDYGDSLSQIFIGSFIFAHLGLVLFRSHANPVVFRAHPLRFTLVPLVLLAAVSASVWVAVSVSVLATWWDVYHSSLQTFGIGRIYDQRSGNDVHLGRRLDYWLNLLLYVGPILAGAALMDHVGDFDEFSEVGSVFFTAIPAAVESKRGWLTWGVLALGIPFLVFYVGWYWQQARKGYRVSFQKVALLVSTALCSIVTWGFNPFGEAFFVMNFFHALQYFAIVWWSEKRNLLSLFRLDGFAWGAPAVFAIFLGSAFGFGLWAEALRPSSSRLAYGVVMVVSIMHFWYDGFIWSVRRNQV